jgi:hypothetical protein
MIVSLIGKLTRTLLSAPTVVLRRDNAKISRGPNYQPGAWLCWVEAMLSL